MKLLELLLGLTLVTGCTVDGRPTDQCPPWVLTPDGGVLPDAADDSAPRMPGYLPNDECAAICGVGIFGCTLVDASPPAQVQCIAACP